MDLELLKTIQNENSGIIRTSDFTKQKVDYRGICRLLDKGIIVKIKNGYYRLTEESVSEEETIRRLFPDGVLCMQSGLYYYGYTKKLPAEWHMAVDKNTSKTRFKQGYPFIKPHYMENKLLYLGMEEVLINNVPFKVYDRDRLICDCIKYENKIERYDFNTAITAYIRDDKKNISRLLEYGKMRNIYNRVYDLLGVWIR